MSRAPAKRFLDIEHALRWAYRDELPKRHAVARRLGTYTQERVWSPYIYPAGYPEVSPSFREATGGGPSGGYADGWSRDPGFPQVLGEPHADAIAIEAAVKGLSAWAGHGFGPDDAAGLMHGLDLAAWAGHLDHIQAGMEAVAMMAGLIAVHARAGTRPRWSRQLPEPFPDTGGNGKPKVLIEETFVQKYDRAGMYYEPASDPPPGAITVTRAVPSPPIRAGRYRPGAYCPLIYRPSPAGLVRERAEYAAWRMGLEILAGELEGKLASIAVLTPAAPWRPWAGPQDEGELHGRVPDLFRGQRDEPYRRETREQAAARRRAGQRRKLQVRTEETRPVRRMPVKRDNGTNGA